MGYHVVALLVPAIFLIAFPTAFVLLRLIARGKAVSNLGIDDLLIIPALVCHVGICICAIIRAFIGNVGFQSPGSLSSPQRVAFGKAGFALALLVVAADGLVKLSLLFLYRRLFGCKGSFRRVNSFLIILIISWTAAVLITLPVLCLPLGKLWTNFEIHQVSPHCSQYDSLYIGYTASDILTDIFVLTSPIAAVWSLQMRTAQKFWVSLVFLLGFVSVAAGAVRVAEFVVAWKSYLHNKTKIVFSVEVTVWSMVESGLGIICACLPCLPALFRLRRNRQQRRSTELYNNPTSPLSSEPPSPQHHGSLQAMESWMALRPLQAQPPTTQNNPTTPQA